MGEKLIAQNRKARHDYHILDNYEAGIALTGTEVKSLRAGNMNLKDSYVDVSNDELYLVGAYMAPYEQGNIHNHEPERRRKLLMHKREIVRLAAQVAEKGLTLVPLRVYFKRGKAKVEIGLAKGKQTIDKRDTIKERDAKRELERAMKNR